MQPRLIVLLGVAAVTVLLPLAGASAGPVGDGDGDAKSPLPAPSPDPSNAPAAPAAPVAPAAPASSTAERPERPERPLPGGLGTSTESWCGPELSSPDGIEAQTCVLTQGHDTWARTYYRNATGDDLDAVLTVMGPDGRTVQTHCGVTAGDEPGACETPRARSAGEAAEYSAVAEFAADEAGALLLRSGSNSASPQGS
ncbi:hypothetical protein JQK87_02440 [Streptomyces sp. G44]|uniref:hypothetical protein n=1 Tax=Streptomyces sp. G44 TaxID=2807632 RepID=UPI001960A0B1|nr:hypothetical protein [Streptomyces sp. G44]MBM7167297.1 hypothetical protein [Streptomyces sp. G44]